MIASSRPPTPRQHQVYDLIVAGILAGCPPTLRELAERMGIRSTNGIHEHLAALVRKGWLEHRPGERSRLAYWPTTLGPGLARDLPRVSEAWLYHHAEQLADAVGAKLHGRATLVSDDEPRSWWRLVVTTDGRPSTEDAVSDVDPTWHAMTHQATVRGGLHVWAWGPVPDEHGGPLGPVRVVEREG
jgi:hypothetical protein